MIHFHGGPITPDTCALKAWKGRHAFISLLIQLRLIWLPKSPNHLLLIMVHSHSGQKKQGRRLE